MPAQPKKIDIMPPVVYNTNIGELPIQQFIAAGLLDRRLKKIAPYHTYQGGALWSDYWKAEPIW